MNVLKALGAGLVMLAITGWIVFASGPGLVRDYAIQQSWAPANLELGGDCDAGLLVWKFCNVWVQGPDGEGVSDMLMFFDFEGGDYSVNAVQASGDPTLVSSSLAMERYWNRVVSFLAVVGFFGLLGIAGPIAMLRRR